MARVKTGLVNALDVRFTEIVRSDSLVLPPYPATASKLSALMGKDSTTIAQLSRVVLTDQALAAAVLRQANSAASGATREITSVEMAISRLGLRQLMSLAMTIGAGSIACCPGVMMTLRRQVWRQALLAAEIARVLAERRGESGEEAFMCGLLHDFGKVVGIMCLEQVIKKSGRGTTLSIDVCVDVIERYHVELGMVMAAKWKLPEMITDVVTSHHEAPSGRKLSPMSELVICADRVVELLESGPVVSLTDLAGVPYFADDSERAYLHDALSGLAAVVMELDPEADGGALKRRKRSALETPESTLDSHQVPFSAEVEIMNAKLKASYLTVDGMGLKSHAPLRDQTIVPVSTSTVEGPLEFFATVSLCVEDGKGFRVELKPLALPDLAAQRWKIALEATAVNAA